MVFSASTATGLLWINISPRSWRPNIQVIETCCLEMQCAEGCSVETICQLTPWQRLASEKQQTFSFLNIWEPKKHISTNLKSSKRLRSHANTNRNASLHKMLWTQNLRRVVGATTWKQEKKRRKSPGSLRAAWPCCTYISYSVFFNISTITHMEIWLINDGAF